VFWLSSMICDLDCCMEGNHGVSGPLGYELSVFCIARNDRPPAYNFGTFPKTSIHLCSGLKPGRLRILLRMSTSDTPVIMVVTWNDIA